MKIKDGKIKLDTNEKRVGNFVIKSDNEYVKICDINRRFIYSVSVSTAAGLFLKSAYDDFKDEATSRGLTNYIAVLWSLFATVPDIDFLSEVFQSAKSAIERHPEVYGYPAKVSEEDDAEAVKSVKEMKEFEKEVKEMDDAGKDRE